LAHDKHSTIIQLSFLFITLNFLEPHIRHTGHAL
jgi:hypothetical protein